MITIEIQNEVAAAISAEKIRHWAEAAHDTVSEDSYDAVVRISSKEEIQELNLSYRNKDYPTNVLSFVYEVDDITDELDFDLSEAQNLSAIDQEGCYSDDNAEMMFNQTDMEYLGDIIICNDVIKQEADEQNKTYEDHFAHMIVHGVLHLNGYDHEEEHEAEKMERLEVDILAKLNIRNPYT